MIFKADLNSPARKIWHFPLPEDPGKHFLKQLKLFPTYPLEKITKVVHIFNFHPLNIFFFQTLKKNNFNYFCYCYSKLDIQ